MMLVVPATVRTLGRDAWAADEVAVEERKSGCERKVRASQPERVLAAEAGPRH